MQLLIIRIFTEHTNRMQCTEENESFSKKKKLLKYKLTIQL